MTPLNRLVLASPQRLAMPIAVYPGLHISGGTVRQMVTDAAVQTAASLAVRDRYGSPFALSAMDLSAEAEAFGATIRLEENEVPTVLGRLVSDAAGVAALRVPRPGTHRTQVHVETVRHLVAARRPGQLVLGGVIGPFSLAGRLWGVSEFLELTATDPDTALVLIAKASEYLVQYVKQFKQAGADGVVMAEPTAGLLSPKGLARFSSPLVRGILAEVEADGFGVVLHNCGAKAPHLDAILESGASAFHFGAPMDMAIALDRVGPERVVCGNLDPAGVFVHLAALAVRTRTEQLLAQLGHRRTFIASSGCDIPPDAPLANLDAFIAACRETCVKQMA
jgi:uroporphyrinogen decarboxylase